MATFTKEILEKYSADLRSTLAAAISQARKQAYLQCYEVIKQAGGDCRPIQELIETMAREEDASPA